MDPNLKLIYIYIYVSFLNFLFLFSLKFDSFWSIHAFKTFSFAFYGREKVIRVWNVIMANKLCHNVRYHCNNRMDSFIRSPIRLLAPWTPVQIWQHNVAGSSNSKMRHIISSLDYILAPRTTSLWKLAPTKALAHP